MIGLLLFLLSSSFVSEASGPPNETASPVKMDRQLVVAQFETLLPLAVDWASEEEERILREGVALTAGEMQDAKAVGVQQPERVRLLQVPAIPRPAEARLAAAADAIQFLTPATRGLTLSHGIFIRSDCWRDRALIVHELVHVAQYERLGGISPFLRQYLSQCLTNGYPEAPLEKEAVAMAMSHFTR
jgi:hypothetical protein